MATGSFPAAHLAVLAREAILAASVNAMQRDIADALDAGFTDYLTKPLDMQPSAGVVDKLLSD